MLPHPSRGLTADEAAARLRAEGPNELPRARRRTPLRIAFEVLREPMLALLLGGGVLYLALGELTDAVVLLAFAMMSIVLTTVQESRTERVLEALRDLTSPRALVIRDGMRRRIAGREVVRGDIVVLSEGDRVAADGLLMQATDLQVDESLLTGESVPVRKRAATPEDRPGSARPGGDGLPSVFSGTLVVRGAGLFLVSSTGPRSEIGRIGRSLEALEVEPPRLQRQTRRIVRVFAAAGGAVSILAVLLYGALRGGWLDAVLGGIALGMSMLPEEFPVVLTIFMAMGAWRISRARVLTRRAAAIETLGSATVLCTDKTGTLTENRMAIAELRLIGGAIHRPDPLPDAPLPAGFQELALGGVLASAREPFDPMDKAFHALLPGQETMHRRDDRAVVRSYGLRADLLAISQVWSPPAGEAALVVAAKGAPEAIAALCRLDPAARDEVAGMADAMAADGLRVLGVARATHAGPPLPDSQRDFAFEFLGLVGLSDPIRPSVPAAVARCRAAGIRVVMITGDYPSTARAIARQAGLAAGTVMTGEALATMDDSELALRVRDTDVFARIMPEQKLRIVQALKAGGEVVAMTGDGVNDAPSLKAAHIGIAMGGRGTDVAREASSIVLLDDDFGSIVESVRLGRRIYDNLRKAIGFIFAVHVPVAGLALLPLVFGLPILFGPMHIAFLEMVVDPVCALVFEAETEEEGVMRRPPRAPDAPLFSRGLVVWGLVQGLVALALVAAVCLFALRRGLPDDAVRALTFYALVMSIVSLILINRSFSASPLTALRRPNPALAWVMLAVAAILALILLWPVARGLFRFATLSPIELLLAPVTGLVVLGALEAIKHSARGRLRP
ncbi:MAG: cation-translocating P-type ATPase [Alphaproteobacteria bacterium]|nr:cation-translocating P-type ATPase [Alphaproteobacteria bacterium]